MVLGAILGAVIGFLLGLISSEIGLTGIIAIGVLCLLSFIFVYIKNMQKKSSYSKISNPDFEHLCLEPIKFTYNSGGRGSQNFISSLQKDFDTNIKRMNKSIKSTLIWLPITTIVAGLFGLMVLHYSPSGAGYAAVRKAQTYNVFEATEWSGTFEGRSATLTITESTSKGVKAIFKVSYNREIQISLVGNVNPSTNKIHLNNPANSGDLNGKFDGTFNDERTSLTGVYENHNTKKQVKFTFNKVNNKK